VIDAGQMMAYLDLDSKKFSVGMKGAISAVKDLTDKSLSASSKLKGLGSAMGQVGRDATALTIGIAAIGTASVTAYAQLDTASRKVSTVADTAILSLQGIKDGTRELSNELRTMPTDVSAGLYDMISANGDTANALNYTQIAVKAAKGGFTETAVAVDGLTTVMNAYGLVGVDAMQKVSDQMLTAQNYGKTTFGAIAASIGNVIPLAAQLKTGTDELFASLAVLTKQGIGTSEAVTGLKAVYAGILKPTSDATKAAKEMGLDFSASALRAQGLGGFLDQLMAKTGGSADKITALFGSVEALNTVLAMTSEGGRKDFAGAMEAMKSSAGATDKAFETMVGGIEGSFDHVKVAAVNLGSVLAEEAAPQLEELANWLGDAMEGFQKLPPEVRSTIVTVAGLAAALGPVLIIGGKLVAAFGALAGVMSGPAGWIALGIAGVTALAIGLSSLSASAEEAQDAFLAKYGQTKDQLADQTVNKDVSLDVSVSTNAGEGITSAVDKLKGILNAIDVLTDTERQAIIDMIGDDLNPIKSALTAAGLDEGQADAAQKEIDAAVNTLREKLIAMNIVDEATLSKITKLISADKAQLKGSLLAMGLTPAQAEEVAANVVSAQDTIREKLKSLNILSETELRQIMKMVGEDKAQLKGSLMAMGLTEAEATAVANAINASTGTLTSGVYSLYDKIYQALTDGKPDTAEQTTALQTEVQTYYDDLVSGINLDTETKIANLKAQLENGFITMEEYQTRADTITKQNGVLVTSVQQTCTDTLALVADMSGKSTTEVQAALTKIETLKAKALEEAAAIEELARQAQSAEGKNAQFLVKAGAKVDQGTVNLAFDTAYNQKQVDTYGAEEVSKANQGEINKNYQSAYEAAQKEGASPEKLQELTAQRDKLIQDELAKLEAQKQQITDTYNQTVADLFTGLSESNPALASSIQNSLKNLNVWGELQAALEKDLLDPEVQKNLNLSDAAKEVLKNLFNIDIENGEFGSKADGDLGTFWSKDSLRTLLQNAADDLKKSVLEFVNGDEGPLATDFGIIGTTYARLIQEGMLEGLQNPTTSGDGKPIDFASAFLNTITGGTGKLTLEVPIEIKPVLAAPETGTTSTTGTTNTDGQNSFDAQQLLARIIVRNVSPESVTAGLASALGLTPEALYAQIQKAFEEGDTEGLDAISEKLLEVRDGIASSAAEAGKAAPEGVATGVNDNQSLAVTAVLGLVAAAGGPLGTLGATGLTMGVSAIQGLIDGAEKKRTDLVNKFTSLASAAIEAAHKKLEINSPSKVFMRIGAGTVEGFVKGVDENWQLAQKSMNRMTSLSAIGPSQITGAGRATQASKVITNHYGAPVTVTFPGDIHVNDDAELRTFERKQQKFARDLQYGLGG
jgi:TP901 family phage tail tape measure protein